MSVEFDRIASIELDKKCHFHRNPLVEREQDIAMTDILDCNFFKILSDGKEYGPYHLFMTIDENRLAIDVNDESKKFIKRVQFPLTPFRKIIKDYFLLCDTFYMAQKTSNPSRIEAVDMGRRALHDEAAEQLMNVLSQKVKLDHDTARRLFTLICVLHCRV